MAIRDTCPRCGRAICAPDSMRGKRVPCPECGLKTVLRSEEERRREEKERERRERARRRDLARIAFLERLEAARRPDRGAALAKGGVLPVPIRVPRRRRLRVLADFTLLAAYAVGALCAAGAGLTIYLYVEGVIGRLLLVFLACIGWAILGLLGFAGLKFAGELGLLVGEIAEDVGERSRGGDGLDGRETGSGRSAQAG